MHVSCNVKKSPPDENQVSALISANVDESIVKTHPPDSFDPGRNSAQVIASTNTSNNNKKEIEKIEGSCTSTHGSENRDDTASLECAKPGICRNDASNNAGSQLCVPKASTYIDFYSTSEEEDEEEGQFKEQKKKKKKKLTPEAGNDSMEQKIPKIMITDMKEFLKTLTPHKFSKLDNAATKLVQKFKKNLLCPKCVQMHGHTSQSIASTQYGGTSPNTSCRSSVQQLLMCMPLEIIEEVAAIHKKSSTKDMQLFMSWISSSKAEQKEAILRDLRNSMDIESKQSLVSEEDSDQSCGETMEISDIETDIPVVKDATTPKIDFSSYSDAEFRAAIIDELSQLRKRLSAFETETELLRKENEYLRKENAVLKKFKSEPLDSSYAGATKVYMPRPIILKRTRQDVGPSIPKATATKIIPKFDLEYFTQENTMRTNSFETSELCLVHFKGLMRRQQSQYRAVFDQLGFDNYKARDILFLSKDVVQILTYQNCVDDLVEKVTTNFPTVKYIKNADPTDPKLFSELGSLSQEFLTEQYFATMESAVLRFRELVKTKPVFKRSLHFLEKIVETRNTKYARALPQPKIFLMNSFVALDKLKASQTPQTHPIISEPEVISEPENVMDISYGNEDVELMRQDSMETSQ